MNFYDDENRLTVLPHTESPSPLNYWDPPQTLGDRLSEFRYDGWGRLRTVGPSRDVCAMCIEKAATPDELSAFRTVIEQALRDAKCDYCGEAAVSYSACSEPSGERGGLNLYGFVGNRPTAKVDMFGLADSPNSPTYGDLRDDEELGECEPDEAYCRMRDQGTRAKAGFVCTTKAVADILPQNNFSELALGESLSGKKASAADKAMAGVGLLTGVLKPVKKCFGLLGDWWEARKAAKAAKEVKLLGPGTSFTAKLDRQLPKRGWTQRKVQSTIDRPAHTSPAVNKANNNRATAYFDENGAYVVRDDVTGEIIQVSNRLDPNWVPDPTIVDPFLP